MYDGNYEVIAGQWGYNTICSNENITTTNNNLTIVLPEGYYDDFTFDFGWSVSGGITPSDPGRWERGDPEGTSSQGLNYNPDDDVNSDCFEYAYVTGLAAGGQTGSNDVDDFNTILISPLFDLTSNQQHLLNYHSWFANGGGGWGAQLPVADGQHSGGRRRRRGEAKRRPQFAKLLLLRRRATLRATAAQRFGC